MRTLLGILVAIALAGCTASPAAPEASSPPLGGGGLGFPTLPCERDDTPGLSKSLSVLSTLGLEAFHDEIDNVRVGDRSFLISSRSTPDNFDIVDITDPHAPVLLATWLPDEADYADDVKFTPDGTGVVIGGYETLRIVDTRDKAEPVLESTYRLEPLGSGSSNGAHMVAVWELDGRTYVSTSKAEGGDLSIYAILGEPGQRTFRHLARMAATPLGPVNDRPDLVRSHDTWFEVDPVTRQPLLWVANVWWGVIAYDVSDPANPVVASQMLPDPTNPLVGYMHSAQVTHIDGRRLVVGAQEYGTGVLKVWDATDLAKPKQIAYFHHDPATTPFHGMNVVGRYAFGAHFHDGLFVFDLGELDSDVLAPAKMDVFAHAPTQAVGESPRVPVSPGQQYFGTMDVVVQDGIVWTNEGAHGLQALAFGCIPAGDTAVASTG